MKRVLHIYNDYYPPVIGGIEKHLNTLCEGLKDKFEITVLTANRSISTRFENINGINVIRVGTLGRIQSAPITPFMPFWLKYLKADILHFQLPCPTAMLSYFLARPKGKIVVSYQSDIVRQKWAIGLYKPLLNKFLKRADYIIASSPNYIETSPFLRRYKDKTVVIPNGTDINKFYSSDPKEPVILFVGKLRYYKGLNYLIEAMQNIDARLNIIGTGSEELKLKKLTNKLGLNNRINFLGNIPENKLPLYYANCSIFVLPACERSEAFGIVQLEAMASSKPVISTKLGTGLDWVNQDGITGITVPPKDPNALASAINKLLGDENLRKTLGQNTRSKVEKEFSKDLMLKRIHELYIKILCPDI